jgi:hypothetical protein
MTPLNDEVYRAKLILVPQNLHRWPLFHTKCCVDGIKQSRVAEWLEQALHCTLFEHLRTHSLIFF